MMKDYHGKTYIEGASELGKKLNNRSTDMGGPWGESRYFFTARNREEEMMAESKGYIEMPFALQSEQMKKTHRILKSIFR